MRQKTMFKPNAKPIVHGAPPYTEFEQLCAKCHFPLVMAPSLEFLMCIQNTCLGEALQPIKLNPLKETA